MFFLKKIKTHIELNAALAIKAIFYVYSYLKNPARLKLTY